MASISIVYPVPHAELLSRPKVWGQDYSHPSTMRPNREICILMGQSYIVLFTLPFSRRERALRIQLPYPRAEGAEFRRRRPYPFVHDTAMCRYCTSYWREHDSTVFELRPNQQTLMQVDWCAPTRLLRHCCLLICLFARCSQGSHNPLGFFLSFMVGRLIFDFNLL